MKEIPKELYMAFMEVKDSNYEDDKLYDAYTKLAKEHLGDEAWENSHAQGRLIVDLTRMALEIEGDWVDEDTGV